MTKETNQPTNKKTTWGMKDFYFSLQAIVTEKSQGRNLETEHEP